jgi:subtilisin family serine protease
MKAKWFNILLSFFVLVMALAPAEGVLAQDGSSFTATPLFPDSTISFDKSTGNVSVIVKLQGDSLAAYGGDIPGLPATSPRVTGEKKLNLHSQASQAYLKHLDKKHKDFQSQALAHIPQAKFTQDFQVIMNAVAMVLPADQVASLYTVPDVEAVYDDARLQVNTDASPPFIGAPTVWNQLGGQESSGEGVIVGVLDTGVWPEHPSFSDPDPSGKPYSAPKPPLSGTRQCEFSGGANPGPAFTCNNKLIGADRFMATYDAVIGLLPGEFTSARDDNGHGTHTSSTAAGNAGVAASIFGVPRGIISGIAPRAEVIMYKVCGDQGCFSSDSAAAVQKAIQDNVDVINFSISGGANPYADAVSLAFLDAYNANVFVAASAGNSGPSAETVAHREPWVTTVAASTANRAFQNTVSLNGGALTLTGTSLTAGISTPTPIVDAGAAPTNDPLCLNSTADGAFAGKIVICKRGTNGRVEKGFNVLQRGAVGMILYNNAANVTDLETDNHFLPASHIQFADGQALLSFLAANPGATATLTAGVKTAQQGDVMASFSSRGGPAQPLGISKPDVTAPGVQILAGLSPQHVDIASGPQGELFQAIAGTSMSSPHVAGSAALLAALHPDWTPGQIKSALMTTAWTQVVKEDGTTPANAFDYGSGRINLNVAGDPGVTFDATGADYVTFKNQLYRANYPSLYIPSMPGVVTVQRAMRSVIGQSATWKFNVVGAPSDLKISVPSSLIVKAGKTVTFDITVDARAVPLGQTRFATLQITSGNRQLHFPITIVRGQAAVLLDKTCAPGSIPLNTNTTCTLTITNPTFDPVDVSLTDKMPAKLQEVVGSATGGATEKANSVLFTGTVAASQAPTVAIGSGSLFGYIPLSAFGIDPIGGVDDDTITNFNVPSFLYGGEVYTRIGVSSNGYIVIGGGSGPDNSINNQNFPDPNRPNNTLALFWTDLNPGAAGAMRIATLTDGVDTWIVIDWDGVREFSTAGNLHTFELWIGINGVEDITYAYGDNVGNGDGGFLSVGAENRFGNSGQNTYFNGTGTLPSNGNDLRVTTTPGTVSTKVITFQAKGVDVGSWTNYAELTSNAFYGTNIASFSGSVTP